MAEQPDFEQLRQDDRNSLRRSIRWFRERGWDANQINQLYGNITDLDLGPDPEITVVFAAGRATILSAVDQTVELTGDVRDGTVKLTAGEPKTRKLSKSGCGWVGVNGERWHVVQ